MEFGNLSKNSKTLKTKSSKIHVLRFKNLFGTQLENNFSKKKMTEKQILSVFKYLGDFKLSFSLGFQN